MISINIFNKSTKYQLLSIISILLIYSCSAVPKAEKPETLMWEINSKSGGKVFVLGSIHLADESLYPLNPKIVKAYDSSDALVLEIIVDKISPTEVMNYLTFKDERTLETELSPEIYSKIAEKFEKNNIPKYLYNKFKPWFAVMYLQSDEFKSTGLSAGEGIDMHFLNNARGSGKEVLEIESITIQMQLMDELGEYTGEYLKSVIEETDLPKNSMDDLLKAWKNGDDETIEKLSNEGSEKEEFAQVMEKLNYKRNEKMVEKIEEYLKTDKTYFIVVGAAHVVGKRGIIDLFKNKNNYIIKRY
jgi:uncharacterized protein YbaP (TraB family)